MSTESQRAAPDPVADGIAIIGLAVRVPGAETVDAFWQNLRAGVESITFFTAAELRAAGVDAAIVDDERYVKANGVLPDVENFDAEFFGVTPREAEAMDPQHRVFLETAWTAFEHAGYDPAKVRGRVGVFAGAGLSTYLLRNLAPNRAFMASAGEMAVLLGNNKDFAPTRVSYKLDLRGPSVAVNTACSTSLVATHFAVQSLLDFHCELALAGGVSVQVPQAQGYLHTAGGIGSPDGHCRAFDAQAAGTVGGSGVGVVVLKRLAEALVDGDTIYAVIRGSAVNNDGAAKVGFTAPGVEGQAQVIAEAQAVAGVESDTIGYVEAHGTGTELGDPIEIAALTQAFAGGTRRTQFCAVGSVKTNVGHLDEAAGVAGLVKTVLALQHGEIPPSLHFTAPNPKIDFARSPFFVSDRLRSWPRGVVPRRAGVSSFGIGGTNAHVVLEEAPEPPPGEAGRPVQLLVLSARSRSALARRADDLAQTLAARPGLNLADVAHTLAVGRKGFAHRCAVVARDAAEAIAALRALPRAVIAPAAGREVVFMFSGQGSQYPGMLAGLLASEPIVRAEVDRCAGLLRGPLGFDVRTVLDPRAPAAAARLKQTAFTQPTLFVVEYALAKLWLSWGVKPVALIGHSLGEYVAACLAGVFSLEDALALVVARGALMEAMPAGAMLAVALAERETMAVATDNGLALAAVNAPDACVISGPLAAIEQIEDALGRRGVAAKRLETSHAFHSAMMQPMLAAFAAKVRAVRLHAPQLPVVSNVTGQWLTAAEAVDPDYWVRQARQTVRFAAGVALLARQPGRVFLEVGPGRALAAMTRRGIEKSDTAVFLTSARTVGENTDDLSHLLTAAGQLWRAGGGIDWAAFYAGQKRRRLALPTYPFERQRYWVEAPRINHAIVAAIPAPDRQPAFTLATEVPALTAVEQRLLANADLTEAATYAPFVCELEAWCAVPLFHYVARGAVGLGARQRRTDLRERLGVQRPFWKAFDHFLFVLAAERYVRLEGDEVIWLRTPAEVPAVGVGEATLAAKFPEFSGILKLLVHCTAHYPEALSGKVPAITVLYPEGRSDLLEATARETAPHTNKAAYVALLKEVIERQLARTHGRPLRILEVGVGDGLLAGQIAPGLKGRNVTYVATDLGRTFVLKAESTAAAAGLDFMSFAVLDISRDPAPQGFARESFDLIVGLDVVHATPRLVETLGHLRTLLAPGGLLGLIEKVRAERWIDLVWGLAEGWWYFEDTDLRRHTPLLPANDWERVLRGLPFDAVAVFPPSDATRAATDYALLLAQTQGDPEPAVVIGTGGASAVPALDVANWFFVPGWRLGPRPVVGTARSRERVLILEDDDGVGGRLAAELTAAGHAVVRAGIGPAFAATGRDRFVVNPARAEDYRALFGALAQPPEHVVHLWNVSVGDRPAALEASFFSLLQVVRSLGGTAGGLRLSIVANGLVPVPDGNPLHPGKALLIGPLRVIPLEWPDIACRCIDVSLADDRLIEHLAAEVMGGARDVLVACRGGERWVPTIEARPRPAAQAATRLRERGVYLVTGGLGSMGLAFARELARTVRARLVLVGRTSPTPAGQRALDEIEALGAEVLFIAADVANAASMAAAVQQARARFGEIHGVIHTAGVYGQGLIWDRSRAAAEATLAPKVTGVRVLEEIFAGQRLDFLLLCSSLAALKPVAGQVDYCAANAFLDAFAVEHTRRTGTPTTAIGWGVWQELGMMEHPDVPDAVKQAARDEIERAGWRDAGVQVLRRILTGEAVPHVLVSPRPLQLAAPPEYPLFTRRMEEPGGVAYVARLQPSRHWVVDEHRIEGQAILPGTAYLELARAAFADCTGATTVELREVYFLRPLIFAGDEVKEVRVILRGPAFHIVSRIAGERWLEHARGEVVVMTAPIPSPFVPLAVRWEPADLSPDAVRFGPRWHSLREIAFAGDEGFAGLELPDEFAADLPTYALHPALLDLATGFITLRHSLTDSLPFAYRRLAVHRALPARFRSHVRVVARSATTLELDATLTDDAGAVLVEIEGYRLRRGGPQTPAALADNARLALSHGALDAMGFVPASRRAPGPGEVEIQVEAAGLNFIEVLYALGLLPAAPELEESFGLECAGRVVRVGAGVGEFAAGDAVVAYTNRSFAAYVTTAAVAVARRPGGLTLAEAATLPAAFATAHFALVTQGRLAAGDRVLIHAAAGGVGMAAVQIAQSIGAEIFATAGSPEKRAALRALGVTHVMDSRSLAFADEVMTLTRGRGVDVVLNSLSGEFMRRSLELVAPHGRFLELGKRDLLGGGRMDLRPFARIISFIAIDVGPDLPGFTALWREVARRFNSGEYCPLPHTAFAMTAVREAFAFMARAKHIGKVVLTLEEPADLLRASGAFRPPAEGRTLAAILGDIGPAPVRAAESFPAFATVAGGHRRPELATAYTAPTGEEEQVIAGIWAELLGIEGVGTQDNFFDLRGDSLLAAQVMARLQTALRVKLPLSALFDAPTVAGLADRVRSARGGSSRVTLAPTTARTADEEEGEI